MQRSVLTAWVVTLHIAAAVAFTSARQAHAQTHHPALEQRTFELVNDHRREAGRPALIANANLTEAARRYASFLAREDYGPTAIRRGESLGHNRDGTPDQRIREAGYIGTAWGENLYFGFPVSESSARNAYSFWLNSDGHRANMEGDFLETGVGVYSNDSSGCAYFIQVFGTRPGVTSTPEVFTDEGGWCLAGPIAVENRTGRMLKYYLEGEVMRKAYYTLNPGETRNHNVSIYRGGHVGGRAIAPLRDTVELGAADPSEEVSMRGTVDVQGRHLRGSRFIARLSTWTSQSGPWGVISEGGTVSWEVVETPATRPSITPASRPPARPAGSSGNPRIPRWYRPMESPSKPQIRPFPQTRFFGLETVLHGRDRQR